MENLLWVQTLYCAVQCSSLKPSCHSLDIVFSDVNDAEAMTHKDEAKTHKAEASSRGWGFKTRSLVQKPEGSYKTFVTK